MSPQKQARYSIVGLRLQLVSNMDKGFAQVILPFVCVVDAPEYIVGIGVDYPCVARSKEHLAQVSVLPELQQ